MFEYPDSAFGTLLRTIDEQKLEIEEKDERIKELEAALNATVVKYAQNVARLRAEIENLNNKRN